MDETQRLLSEVVAAVLRGDSKSARDLAQRTYDLGISPEIVISKGFTPAMQVMSEKYERGEAFVPEILVSSKAMRAGIAVLRPYLEDEGLSNKRKVSICVIEGDIHDIGKNIVSLLLEINGYSVHDLGRDVLIDDIIDGALKNDSAIIAVSALMTTTMMNMERLIQRLEKRGCRKQFLVAIGGAPLTQSFCNKIGADIYAEDAIQAVRKFDTAMDLSIA